MLLVQAPSVEGPASEIVAPLGLGAVAASARERGHEVRLLDLNLEPDAPQALAAALSDQPDAIGVGLRNIDPLANRRHSFLPAFASVLETVTRLAPDAPIIVGGAGFSMFPRVLMERYPAIDVGVVLEGEETFPEVLCRLGRRRAMAAAPRAEEVAGLPGTIVRVARPAGDGPFADGNDPGAGATASPEAVGGLVVGATRPRLPAEQLDRVRSWLPALVSPYRESTSYAPAAGVETKRGCPLRCSYCVYPALQGRRLRFRSPATIAREVQSLHEEAGIEWVHFTDPVLNVPAPHFRELCRELIARRVPVRWTGFFREDALTAADARLAVQAGCAAFQFSGDGTCDATLARLRKGLRLDDILSAARHAAATEALSVYHFMVNVPGTDAAVVRRAHELVERLHELHSARANLGAIVLNNLRVYPGTPLAQELRSQGWAVADEDLLYPTYHDPAPFGRFRYELEERAQRSDWRSRISSVPSRPPTADEGVHPVNPQRVTLLEHPRQSSWKHMNDVANTPLSSSLMTGYAAAVLEEAGHQVTVVEGNLGGLSPEQTVATVERSRPDLLCVHAVYDWSDGAQLRSLVQAVLAEVGPVPVLLYGFYATFAYEHLLSAVPRRGGGRSGRARGGPAGGRRGPRRRGSGD